MTRSYFAKCDKLDESENDLVIINGIQNYSLKVDFT